MEEETLRKKADNKSRILEATLRVFNRKGLKFTMDDIASELSMSKKTIYTVFKDKETMFLDMVDYCFDSIRECEKRVFEDNKLSTIDKIRKIISVMPESYKDIDFRQLYILKDKYPKIYRHVEERIEDGWETTIVLFEKGIAEGEIRPINVYLFKTIVEATLEQFFQRDVLIVNDIPYNDALSEIVSILVDGIVVR
ncbi:MAG: TetR/AcrR family transcriptional regulator [Lachnospiraceae bacterium]|nr:TetR/AcrR family transcriptional regulator [Lachnospiraceae bacterium]